MLLRSAWLGGLWCCVYLVRPVLDSQGYFPHHGLSVMNWMVAIGLLMGCLILALGVWQRVFSWQSRASLLLLILILLSASYFGLQPWWKLQMMLLHALSLLGVLWFLSAPRRVL
ncbi:hypothetical protein [Oceanobacter mangrovi]|uniref:hypothetical protein n=1 Tax=Oceanobacter mangrovi TaxID=2862510 RepID=UPI001C8DF15A|nr:hypothetical protein [Oceanobacter mangrovi]